MQVPDSTQGLEWPRVPDSTRTGLEWPRVPEPFDALVFAVLHQLRQSERLQSDALRALQFSQLFRVLDEAVRKVPYYRARSEYQLALARYAPADSTQEIAHWWQTLPVLSRRALQAHVDELRSTDPPRSHGKLETVTSSGSTGTPVSIQRSGVVRLFNAALTQRYHAWHRRDFKLSVAGIHVLKDEQEKAARAGLGVKWAPSAGRGEMFFLSVTTPVREQLTWLLERRPAYLVTYPSNLRTLIVTGNPPPSLLEVITFGEVVEDSLRQACEKIWNVRLVDSYSAQEVGAIALQCPERAHYHVQAESVLVEIVDERGTWLEPGKVGRVLVSSLQNFVTPLLRYDIGDYAELGGSCSCGRGLPVLQRVLGRQRNMLKLPDGEQIWPRFYSDDLRSVAPVVQVQLVQTSTTEIDVNLVVERPLTSAEKQELKRVMRERLVHPFDLHLRFVGDIPRAASGKFEDFRSLA